jgi:alpha/beta superfamily hydrolase
MTDELRYFKNSQGIPLAYKLILKQTSSSMLFIIVHGVLNNKDSFPFPGLSEYLPYNTLRFDFTGCGNSGGVWHPKNIFIELRDLRDVVIHARGLGYDVAGLIGHSRGANLSIHYSYKYRDIPLYILLSGSYADGFKNFIRLHFPDVLRFGKCEFTFFTGKYELTRDEFEKLKDWNTREALHNSTGIVYMISGDNDNLTEIHYIYDRIRSYVGNRVKDFYIIGDANHSYKKNTSLMYQKVKDYIQQTYNLQAKL